MNKELVVKGTQEFLGMNIPVIEGGFGEDKKVILSKTIAEVHSEEARRINEIIKRNLDEFEFGIDILDLKEAIANCDSSQNIVDMLLQTGFTIQGIRASKNIYLLSEQGYMLLVGFMKTEKAKEIRKQLRREYFAMREMIKSEEQTKKDLLMKIYGGGVDSILSVRELVDIETEKAREEVVEELQPKVEIADTLINSKNTFEIGVFAKVLGIKGMGRNKLFQFLRDNKILMKNNTPYSNYEKYFEVRYVPKENKFKTVNTFTQTKINTKGMQYILKKLQKAGYDIGKTIEQILDEIRPINIHVVS